MICTDENDKPCLLLNIVNLSQELMVLDKGTAEYSFAFAAFTHAIAEASELIALGRERKLAMAGK